ADFSVAEIDLGRLQLRLRRGDLRRQGALVRDVLVELLLLSGGRLQQVAGPRELLLGKSVLRLELGDIGFVGIDLGPERRLLEQIEEVALLDLGPLDKLPLFEKRGNARDQRYPPDRLNAADEFVALGDLLAFGPDHADRRRPELSRGGT